MEERIFVDVQAAADVMGKTVQWVRKLIAKGEIAAEAIEGSVGRGGISYLIPVEALPVEAQLAYYQRTANGDGRMDADLVAYRNKYGADGLTELLTMRRVVVTMQGMREAGSKTLQADMRAYAEKIDTSLRTIYRWEARYKEQGIAGLMRKGRSDKGETRSMCYEARRFIWEQYLTPQRRTQEGILANLRKRAAEMGAGACENCPFRAGSDNRDAMIGTDDIGHYPECAKAGEGIIVPANRSAVNEVIDQLTDEEKDYMRKGRKCWKAAHMYKNTRRKPELVNECWFGDHHQLDAWFADENGKPVRPWLTIWYDIASGLPVGKVLSTCPNSQTITEAFTRAVAAKKSPMVGGLIVEGLPVTVYVDNGKDYRCERLEGANITEASLGKLNGSISTMALYEVCGVQVVHAKPYHGWAKPVERWFRTLEDRYMREYKTYCGSCPEERPENFDRMLKAMTERGELPTLDELYKRMNEEFFPAYAQTPHAGYDGEKPAERYARLAKARTDVPSWNTLALAKEEVAENRLITTQGLRFKNRLYWDYAMAGKAGQKVTVRYNRECLDTITVLTQPKKKGETSLFICEAAPKETLKMVGEDEERLSRFAKIGAIQERQLRRGLEAKGVTPPRKRSSGHIYYDDIDTALARGNISNWEAEHIAMERTAARERREAQGATESGAGRNGEDRVAAMFRREYERMTAGGHGA